jgi:hypothetical protein
MAGFISKVYSHSARLGIFSIPIAIPLLVMHILVIFTSFPYFEFT